MKKIDLAVWDRRPQFELFSKMAVQQYSVTFPLDVTHLKKYARAHGISFYLALTYLVTETMNGIENFRYKIHRGEVWLAEKRHPSFTDMKPGSDLFHITTLRLEGPLDDFCRRAQARSAAQEEFMSPTDIAPDEMVYISCLPWLELSALRGEHDNDPDDATPRATWGRYVEFDGRLRLNMAVEVNHRLVDGVHIGRFAQALQRAIDTL